MCKPEQGGTIYYNKELTDFAARLEFRLPPGGNNGLAIRYPGEGDTAYVGMCELQILDDSTTKYGKLDPRQYHGSAYGMVPAKVGYQRPVGLWNFQEVTVKGSKIKVAQRHRDSRRRPEHRQGFHGQLRPPRQGPGLRLLWSRRPQRPGRVPQHRNQAIALTAQVAPSVPSKRAPLSKWGSRGQPPRRATTVPLAADIASPRRDASRTCLRRSSRRGDASMRETSCVLKNVSSHNQRPWRVSKRTERRTANGPDPQNRCCLSTGQVLD